MATFGMAIFLLTQFDASPLKVGYQLVESHTWIQALGVRWTLGVDGISLFMVALGALLFPIAILASAKVDKAKQFIVWMLLLESAMIGVFLALDAMVFFIFFEFVLVPMYFLIAGWGHDNRRYAAMKFFLYTMAGSAFLFAGIVSVAFMREHSTHVLTFDVRALTDWSARTFTAAPPRRCSWRSRSGSRSRCRCSRSTRGCPTRTPTHRPRAQSSWPA